jgi:hypothetical protein
MSADSRRGSGDETVSTNAARNWSVSVSGKFIRSKGNVVRRMPVLRTGPSPRPRLYVGNATDPILFRADEGEFASDAPQVTSYSFVAQLWNRRGLSAQASCLAGAKNFAEAANYAEGPATNFDIWGRLPERDG